ncbi:MAG: sulfotransferase, partial [Pseudomonadota bacterium]
MYKENNNKILIMNLKKNNHYSVASKILHYLALNYPLITQTSFEIEKLFNKNIARSADKLVKPVFISGLARSGSTLITRLLYDTNAFVSLTYRNMPFILMPNIWGKFAAAFRKDIAEFERPHNDGIKVNYDSPEAFDEVFWRIYSGNDYIRDSYLENYQPTQQLQEDYSLYIKLITNNSIKGRYLSKNNNNILRLQTIANIFPDANIIIPFRDPIQQAFSLLKQHRNFHEIAKNDSFSVKYMNWLGHYEFGVNNKYFKFPNNIVMPNDQDNIDYWITQWINVYNFVLNNAPKNAIFICYEELCAAPQEQLSKLFNILNVKKFNEQAYEIIKPSISHKIDIADSSLIE